MTKKLVTAERLLEHGHVIMDSCPSSRPVTILPPIPRQKFVDVYTDKDLQTKAKKTHNRERKDYDAECLVYRALESLNDEREKFESPDLYPDADDYEMIVLHNFEYTREQSEIFIDGNEPTMPAGVKLPSNGEHDFVCIIKKRAIVLFEVKNPDIDNDNADKKARQQLTKMSTLIAAISKKCNDPPLTIFRVSAYPYTIKDGNDETSSLDLILSKDNMGGFKDWWQEHIVSKISTVNETMKTEATLVGLWCVNKNNDMVTDNCSLVASICEVNSKLRSEKIYRDPKDRSENIISASAGNRLEVFRKHLNIDYITKEQHECFVKNRILINGAAGTGKSILIQAKIIDIMTKNKGDKVILILPYRDSAVKYIEIFREADIKAINISLHGFKKTSPVISTVLEEHQPGNVLIFTFVTRELFKVHLQSPEQYTNDLLSALREINCHIFIDDFQEFFWLVTQQASNIRSLTKSVVKMISSEESNPVVWIVMDPLQVVQLNDCDSEFYSKTILLVKEALGECPDEAKMSLTTDLRNTYEIANLLKIIREHSTMLQIPEGSLSSQVVDEEPSIPQTVRNILPPQQHGHFIRGSKPHLYCVFGEGNCWTDVKGILKQELSLFFGVDEKIEQSDVAIIPLFRYIRFNQFHKGLVSARNLGPFKYKIKDLIAEIAKSQFPSEIEPNKYGEYGDYFFSDELIYSYSLEFPVVILVVDLTSAPEDEQFIINILSYLYVGISRARVYCTIILVCEDDVPSPGLMFVYEMLKSHVLVKCVLPHDNIG